MERTAYLFMKPLWDPPLAVIATWKLDNVPSRKRIAPSPCIPALPLQKRKQKQKTNKTKQNSTVNLHGTKAEEKE